MAHDLFETHRKDLHDLSDTIWHNPELAFEERAAHDSITDFFVKAGIGTVTKNYLLETAFKGSGMLVIKESFLLYGPK